MLSMDKVGAQTQDQNHRSARLDTCRGKIQRRLHHRKGISLFFGGGVT